MRKSILLISNALILFFTLFLQSCEEEEPITQCSEIQIESKKVSANTYAFSAKRENVKESDTYQWSINDSIIRQDTSTLRFTFEVSGTYTVCVLQETPECPKAVRACTEVTVEVPVTPNPPAVDCPDVEFEVKSQEESGVVSFYKQLSDEDIKNEHVFEWFIDDTLIESEGTFKNGEFIPGDGKFEYQFEVGEEDQVYKVCLGIETPDCPQSVVYCKEVTIKGKSEPVGECPDLNFDRDGDFLYADFKGIDNLEWYGWYLNDELLENEGTNHNGDNKFSLEGWNPGSYNICLRTETPDCDQALFCKSIRIEATTACPDLSFEIIKNDDGTYTFDILNKNEVKRAGFIDWTINQETIEMEGEGPDRTVLDGKVARYQLAKGRYSICVLTESPECTSYEKCEILVVE